ncbi:MAG: hypothetical protein KKG21_04105 [Candidatus Omnitrophica bacterium]|nr:hypothetical protein [Candidatus Omnitrophota bacterium]
MKSKILLVVFVLTLTIIGGGFCFAGEFYPARVSDISDREYEEVVIKLIDNAKESVVIGMYHISTQLEANNPVKLLLNDLVEAEERGVQVRIYLNTKFPDVSYEELTGEDEFFLNLEDAGLGLGLAASWDDEALRRQVIKALRTLENRYDLIEVEFSYASDAHVIVLPVQGESFTIETDTLNPHDKETPQRLKFLLLVKELLEKEGNGLDAVSQKEIMRRFHIAERTLEKALADLKNILP